MTNHSDVEGPIDKRGWLRIQLTEMARDDLPGAIAAFAVVFTGVAVYVIGTFVAGSAVHFTPGSDWGDGGSPVSREGAEGGVLVAVLATAGVSGLVWWNHHKERTVRMSRPGARCVASFAVFGSVLIVVGLLAHFVLTGSHAVTDNSAWATVWTLSAGFIEEPVFAALPTVIASFFPRKKLAVLVSLIALSALSRGVMHLYQGWESGVLAVGWGAAAAITYALLGSLFGLIAAHVLHNLTLVLAADGNWWWVALSVGVVALAALWSMVHRQGLADAIKSNAIDNKGDRAHAVTNGHP